MGLSCKMHDGVDALYDEEAIHHICTSNVALDKLELGGCCGGVQMLEVGAGVELVRHHVSSFRNRPCSKRSLVQMHNSI